MDSTYTPRYDRRRRDTAVSVLRENGIWALSEDARLAYAVGLVICDDTGRYALASIKDALRDPFVVTTAQRWLREAAA